MPRSDDFCIFHGPVLEYDCRSGFDFCPKCQEEQSEAVKEDEAGEEEKV